MCLIKAKQNILFFVLFFTAFIVLNVKCCGAFKRLKVQSRRLFVKNIVLTRTDTIVSAKNKLYLLKLAQK